MINILIIIILTLLIYSAIVTVVYMITNENDDIAIIFGLGIVGWLLMGFCWIIRKIKHWEEYHNKRSIIEIVNSKEQKWCNLKDTNDIYMWHKGYKLIKRYAKKDEWNKLQPFNKDFIITCKRNCDNCIYNGKECLETKMLCKDTESPENYKGK